MAARSQVGILFRILLPPGIREGYVMREYLGSHQFLEDTKDENDQQKMDDIYLDAMDLTHGNHTLGLLAAAFGVFEHKTIPLDIFGLVIPVPLTSESQERFDRRVSHLPVHLYNAQTADVDKLQHFFSSAWLKKVLGMDWIVNIAGNFVEVFEDAMVLGGSNDPRDKHANRDGLEFANHLDHCEKRLPSTFLTPNP
jgi:hypothetical protein